MKKSFLALCLAFILIAAYTGTTWAAGVLTVKQETFYVLPYNTYFQGVVYAELTNTGDAPFELNGGLLELFGKDGTSLTTTEPYNFYPAVLQPGETGLMYASQYLEEAITADYIASYKLSLTTNENLTQITTAYPATARYEKVMDNYGWTTDYIIATIENNTDATVYGVYTGLALKDADGKLLYVSYSSTWDVGILPNTSVELRAYIDSTFVDYMAENNIKPASAECLAYTSSY